MLIDLTVVLAGVLLPPVPLPEMTPVEPPPVPIPLVAPAEPGPVLMPELLEHHRGAGSDIGP